MTATLPLQLKQLRLPTMVKRWEALTQQAQEHGWGIPKCLSLLCEEELCAREERRLSRHLSESRLPKGKTLASYDFSHIPHLNKERVMGLASQSLWLKEGGNVLLFGPSGVGKTHLAVAIGTELVHRGHRVFFSRTGPLVQRLQKAKRDLELSSMLNKLEKYDCLILDDFGYVKKTETETSTKTKTKTKTKTSTKTTQTKTKTTNAQPAPKTHPLAFARAPNLSQGETPRR